MHVNVMIQNQLSSSNMHHCTLIHSLAERNLMRRFAMYKLVFYDLARRPWWTWFKTADWTRVSSRLHVRKSPVVLLIKICLRLLFSVFVDSTHFRIVTSQSSPTTTNDFLCSTLLQDFNFLRVGLYYRLAENFSYCNLEKRSKSGVIESGSGQRFSKGYSRLWT